MVRHRTFWTLPGGGIDLGEKSAAAAVRELYEETGLRGDPVRELFAGCWLMKADVRAPITIGRDPELDAGAQALRGVAWFTLEEKREDHQVSRVIESLDAADLHQ